MTKPLNIGQSMWRDLAAAFDEIMAANAQDHVQRAQLWAGFMAAAAGAMTNDLGLKDAQTILDAVQDAARHVDAEKHKPPTLTRVK